MMLTEEEARKTICHKSMGNTLYSHGSSPRALCAASNCMAWRWNPRQAVGEYKSNYGSAQPEKRRGFCGLAGGPQA